jgi:tRNA (adenine57-N1/adenine58-N1)-methyltransferase
MDFARPLVTFDSTASRSGIRHQTIPAKKEPEEGSGSDKVAQSTATEAIDDGVGSNQNKVDSDLDTMLLEAANQAAVDLFLGMPEECNKKFERRVNAQDFKETCLPPQENIKEGDLVVIVISFDCLSFVYAKPKAIFSNRHGHFHHDDFIGKPFGCKIRSRNNRGYGYCYLLKPTPELWTRSLNHRTQIVHELDQSQIVHQLWLRPNMTVVETGTGSAALSHALLRAIAPFGHLHTYEFHPERAAAAKLELEQHASPSMVTVYHKDVCGKGATEEQTPDTEKGGFDLPEASVDALFLDLPEPWLAIPHAAHVLKPNARIATYSPCVEQSQRTIQAMKSARFHSIQTMEYRLQEHYVDDYCTIPPPRAKRKRLQKHDLQSYLVDQPAGNEDIKDESTQSAVQPPSAPESTKEEDAKETTTMLVARPFVTMRGHTAFLTFATAGLRVESEK